MLRRDGQIKLPNSDDPEGLKVFAERLNEAQRVVAGRLGVDAVEAAQSEEVAEPAVIAEQPSLISYDEIPHFGDHTRLMPTEVLSNYYKDPETPERKVQKTLGKFFAPYGPYWDRDGKDTVFILDAHGLENPNPNFDVISVDPDAEIFGKVIKNVLATDFGLRPCGYGNHISAYDRLNLGVIDPTAFWQDGEFVARPFTLETTPGSALLSTAIERYVDQPNRHDPHLLPFITAIEALTGKTVPPQ